MAAWAGTLKNFTDVGGDLVMDDLTTWAEYETAAQDVGTLDWNSITIEVAWQKGAGDLDGATRLLLETAFSEDDITYSSYRQHEDQTGYWRYYKMRITAYTDPGSDTPPKVTRLEAQIKQARGSTAQMNVLDTATLTPPGAPTVGARYLIDGTGAGGWAGKDNMIAECVESTTPSWIYYNIGEGTRIWDETANELRLKDDTSVGHPYCLQGRRPIGSAVEVNISGSLTTVLEVTGLAGTLDHDKDEFFIKLHYTTGNPFSVGDQVRIQIDDGVGGGYLTAFNIVPGVAVSKDVFFRFHITRGAVNTDCIVDHHHTDTNAGATNGLTNTAGTFGADWMGTMTKIKVLAMGDTGALAACWIYADRNI